MTGVWNRNSTSINLPLFWRNNVCDI